MRANVRIGNGVGIDHASNHERRPTNHIPILHILSEKIDNRTFGSAAHIVDAAFQPGRVCFQLSHRCVIRLPRFRVTRVGKIDYAILVETRRANGTSDKNQNCPAGFHTKSEGCSFCFHFGNHGLIIDPFCSGRLPRRSNHKQTAPLERQASNLSWWTGVRLCRK